MYPVRGIEQGGAPQRTKNSPVDCFLARGRFPRVSPKNTPAYAGVFFRVSRARNRTGRCAAAHKKQSSGLFLARGRFPRVSPETLQLMLECFLVYPVRGIEPDGAQVLLCAIMERCVFGCILDMKYPQSFQSFFSVYSRGSISKKHRASYFLFCLPAGGVALGQGDGAYDGNAKGQGNGNF